MGFKTKLLILVGHEDSGRRWAFFGKMQYRTQRKRAIRSLIMQEAATNDRLRGIQVQNKGKERSEVRVASLPS